MLRALELRLGFNRLDRDDEEASSSPRRIKDSLSPIRIKAAVGSRGRGMVSQGKMQQVVPVEDNGLTVTAPIPTPEDLRVISKEDLTKEFWRQCENGDIVAVLSVMHRIDESEHDSKFLAHAFNEYGNNSIMYCCWGLSHDPQLLQLLLDNGADPTVVNAEGSSPLHECCIAGKIEMVKLLLANPVVKEMIDHRDDLRRRRTPLVCAVGYGHVHIVRMLLENGASLDDPSPLKIGCRYRQQHTVLALLEFGGKDRDISLVEEQWPEICLHQTIAGLVKWKRRKHWGMFCSSLKQMQEPHRVFLLTDINAEIASFL